MNKKLYLLNPVIKFASLDPIFYSFIVYRKIWILLKQITFPSFIQFSTDIINLTIYVIMQNLKICLICLLSNKILKA